MHYKWISLSIIGHRSGLMLDFHNYFRHFEKCWNLKRCFLDFSVIGYFQVFINKNFVDEDDESEATRPELRQPSGFGLHALFSPLKKGLRLVNYELTG